VSIIRSFGSIGIDGAKYSNEGGSKREAFEETGLNDFISCCYIGKQEVSLPEGQFILLRNAAVYSRPDFASAHWAELRRESRYVLSGSTEILYRCPT